MKKVFRVLILENRKDEQEKARKVVEDLDLEVLFVTDDIIEALERIREADIILTDLHFPVKSNTTGEPPAGLVMAIAACYLHKPIAIVTSYTDDPKAHHGQAVSWLNDGCIWALPSVLGKERGDVEPLLWVKEKDWNWSLEYLLEEHPALQ